MFCHFPSGSLQTSTLINSASTFQPLIPGADRSVHTWALGESLVQHWKVTDWEIHYSMIATDVPAIFEIRQDGESIILLLALNGKFKVQDFITGMHELEASDGLLLHLPNAQGYITCLPVKPFSRLLLITHKRSEEHKELDPLIEDARQFKLSTSVFELTDKILYANYSELRPFHEDQLITLMQVIKELLLQPLPQPHFTTDAITALHEVKAYIDRHLDKEYRLHQLARKAGMNARKLNLGFKNLFGVTLFVYLREQRLQDAHDRILSTRTPLKQIARSAGYRSYSNFSSAFILRFGYGPASLRK
jgi:AraC-like DNA-binding protein